MGGVQVAVHTDEDDAAALFLYRKLIREPIEAPVFMPGPAVEATDAEMQVGPHSHLYQWSTRTPFVQPARF